MTLRPGGGPARLLLELWQRQANGQGTAGTRLDNSPALTRLFALQFVKLTYPHSGLYSLTQAGRHAAQALDASSR